MWNRITGAGHERLHGHRCPSEREVMGSHDSLDSRVSSGGNMKQLDSRNLREKTWQGFEMGGSEGEGSIGICPKLVHLRHSLR